MKKTIITVLCVLFTLATIAAEPDSIKRNLEDYDFLTNFTEKNYAPFSTIMEKGYKREYKAMKKQFRRQIRQGEAGIEKAAIDYVLWFYGRFDRHIMINTEGFRKAAKTFAPKDIEIIEYAPKAVSCKVDSCTWLIRVPSCDPSFEKWTSNAFLQFLKSNCENLIIDLRGNLGGSDGVWNNYYVALYDHPNKPSILWVRNTPENLHHWDYTLESPSSSKHVREFIERCKTSKKKFEKWWEKEGDMGLQPTTYIKRAAVLIDWNTASAAESLVTFVKKYSDRAKVYGIGNTFGANQSGNCHYVTLPNSKIGFQYATTVASDFFENDFSDSPGITPDIIIPLPYAKTLTDNIDEWVLWVAEDLKR